MSDVIAMFIDGAIEGGTPTYYGRGVTADPNFFIRNMGAPHDPKTFPYPGCDRMGEYPACAAQPGAEDFHQSGAIVTYAWYLMTFGGTHESNGQVVPCGLGWAASQKLWWEVETHTLPHNPDIPAVANATLSTAKKQKLNLQPVACAWVAVEALSAQDAQTKWHVTCPPATGHVTPADAGGSLVTPSPTPLLCGSTMLSH